MTLSDEAACKAAIIRTLNALDRGRYDRLSEQYTERGVWHRQGEKLVGRGAIVDALRKRPAHTITRHLAHNLEIEFFSPEHARAWTVVVVFRHDPDSVMETAPIGLPRSIIDYEDTLEKVGGRWLIAERKSRRVFASH